MTNTSQLGQANQYKLRKWSVIFFLLLGIGALVASVKMVSYWKAHQPQHKSRPPVTELPFVETMPITLSDNPVLIRAGGFVSAKTTANITPQVNAKVIALSPNLAVGQRVKKGEVLVRLDAKDYQIALTRAQANLASAKAKLTEAQSQYQQLQGQARQAAREVKDLGLKATPLNLRKPQLAAAKASIANAKAAILSANAQLKQAELNLKRTKIIAPFDAVVQSVSVALGEVASANKVITELVAIDAYTVKMTVDSQAMQFIRIGQAVTLTDTIYGKTYQTVLSRFAAGLDEKNRTIAVYADVTYPIYSEQPLLLQSYLHASIKGKTIHNSVKIPNSAIVDNAYVWAKKADDSVAKVAINIVYRAYGSQASLVTINAPVSDIIIRPKDDLNEGQKVTTNRQLGGSKEKSVKLSKSVKSVESDKSNQISRIR